jgi:L-malate glycosyltransferase
MSVHTQRWIGYFAERGHEVHLLLGQGDPVRALEPLVRLHRYRRFGRRRLPLLSSLQGRRALRRLLAEIQPDVLHAHYLTRHGWQARLSGFQPYVITGWGSDLLLDPTRSLRARAWAYATLHGAAMVTAPSRNLLERAVSLGARSARIQQIAFGVDTSDYVPNPAARRPDGLDAARVVFSPRAILPIYRHDVIVRAVAALPEDVVLVMTGRNADASYRSRLEQLGTELGLGERMRVIDEIEPEFMRGLFQSAEAVVSVPESDGMPSSVLEAMACGVPVVVSDLAGPREALGRMAPELVVPIGDHKALAEALKGVMTLSAAERARLAAELRERCVTEYDQNANLQRMENLYYRIAAAA